MDKGVTPVTGMRQSGYDPFVIADAINKILPGVSGLRLLNPKKS